ncbi:GSCOCG00011809001-RA-CDS, partial [Cotesia congregata]
RRGLSVQTAEIMLSSLTENTVKQYSNPIKLWWQFCNKKGLDPFEISESELLDFLSIRFEAGASYGTLNSMRAAISLIAGTNLSDSVLLNRFFKGVFKQRPLKARYDRTWDPKIVLDFLEKWSPVESLNLSELTKKVATLLALGTGHRLQTLAAISLTNIKKSKTGLEIEIKDLIKTSKKGRKQPLLQLPTFKEKPQLCIVTHVLRYIEVTKKLRKDCKKLLITWKKPHKEASSQTISRWIKSVLSASGVSEEFTGYSTRHASTSSAFRKGLDINVIKSTAGWSKSSEVFARFYNRPL